MPDAIDILWNGARLTLLAQRAVLMPDAGALLVADLHLGKSAAFRALGAPLPEGDAAHDLDRLSALIDRHAPASLYILGDMLHAREGRSPEVHLAMARFRARHTDLAITLVRGNHDERAGDPPAELSIRCVDAPFPLHDIQLVHDPHAHDESPRIGGHIHPAARLSSRLGASLRAPCFWLTPEALTLPAFGLYTGGRTIRPARADRVFVVNEDSILETGAQTSTSTRT